MLTTSSLPHENCHILMRSYYRESISAISMIRTSLQTIKIASSSPDQLKPNAIKLVFVTSELRQQHWGENIG